MPTTPRAESETRLIAPCGLNCGLCRAHGRARNPCRGCRVAKGTISNTPTTCAIRNCKELTGGNHRFCTTCPEFPCTDLLHLARRYRANYRVNIIANLLQIESIGINRFFTEETVKWSCPRCGTLLCMHKARCPQCGHAWGGLQTDAQPIIPPDAAR
jgi:hypothetical protein